MYGFFSHAVMNRRGVAFALEHQLMKNFFFSLCSKIVFLLILLEQSESVLQRNYQVLFLGEAVLLTISFFLFPRLLRWTLGTVLLVAHVLQFVNLFETGRLVEVLTILNLPAATISIAPTVLAKLSAVGITYSLLWIPDLMNETKIEFRSKVGLITLIGAILYSNYLLTLPTYSFFKVVKAAYRNMSHIPQWNDGTEFLRQNVVTTHNDYIHHYTFLVKKPNVVLLFAEGTSEVVLNEKLTPNTVRFLNKSIRFSNYFNHTAATFRGIRGQMISGYQYLGGYYKNQVGVGQMSQSEINSHFRDRVESLPSILEEHGYRTVFCSPHSRNEQLAVMLKATGFKETYGFEEFGLSKRELNDREQYEHILQVLQEHDKRKDDRPIFLSAYIVGTHHGMDSNEVKYGTGENSYLNKFHNQDVWFGRFMNELSTSGLLKETIVVWTTDHATYPTSKFNSTFHVSKNYFVDKIPLGIYYPGVKPVVIDAKNRNSLSLTPTLLDILGIRKQQNHFLGRSLFSDEESPFNRISNIGNNFYSLENGVITEKSEREMPRDLIRSVNRYYGFSSSAF